MRKLILGLCVVAGFSSCRKEKCVSCIAESVSGKIVNYTIECDKSNSFISGFVDGLRKFYKDNGDTVTVKCIYY